MLFGKMKRKRKSASTQLKTSLDSEENEQKRCSDTFVRNSTNPQEPYQTCSIINQNLSREKENRPVQSKIKEQNYPLVPYCPSTAQIDSTSISFEADSHPRSSRNPHICHLCEHSVPQPNVFRSTSPFVKTENYQGLPQKYIIAPKSVFCQLCSAKLATQIHPYENIYPRTTYGYGTPESYAKSKELRDGITFIGCNCTEGNGLYDTCPRYRCMHFMDEVHPSTYDGVNLSPETCYGHSCQNYRTPFQDKAPPIESVEENYHHFPLSSNCSRFYTKIIPCEMANECCRCNTSCCASITPPALGRSNANYHLYSYEHPTTCKMNHCDCYYDYHSPDCYW